MSIRPTQNSLVDPRSPQTAKKEGVSLLPSLQRLVLALIKAKGIPPKPRSKVQKERGLSQTDFYWAAHAWQGLFLSLTTRKGSKHVVDEGPAEEFILKYADRSKDLKAHKWLKFHLTYLHQRAFEQDDLPTPPGPYQVGELPGVLGGGWVFKVCRNLMNVHSSRNRLLAHDLLMAKVGMPAVDERFIEQSLKSHYDEMTSDPDRYPITGTQPSDVQPDNPVAPQVPSSVPLEDSNRAAVRARIKAVVHHVYAKTNFRSGDSLPKLSACFERGVSTGGQFGHLLSGYFRSKGWLDPEEFKFRRDYLKTGARYYANERLYLCSREGEIYVKDIVADQCYALNADFQEYVDESVSRILTEEWIDCTSCAIPEPLKCRIITKARAAATYRATEIQKFLWSHLKTVRSFRLIGERDTENILSEMFPINLPEHFRFISGDYDGATNKLLSEMSDWCWECICSETGMSSQMRELGRRMLVAHRLHCYTGRGKKSREWIGEQRVGQMMGSPMSFPILCLINAAAFLTAYDEPVSFLDTGPLLINGDDILFVHDVTNYEHWWQVNKSCGLYPSLGKQLISDKYAEINSHLYKVRTSQGGPEFSWEHLPYVNTALLQCMFRKGQDAGQSTDTPWFELPAVWQQVSNGFSEKVQKRMRKTLINFCTLPSNLPIDLPAAFGGPGLIIGAPGREACSYASWFLTRPKAKSANLIRQRPTPGKIGLGALVADAISGAVIGHDQVEVAVKDDSGHIHQTPQVELPTGMSGAEAVGRVIRHIVMLCQDDEELLWGADGEAGWEMETETQSQFPSWFSPILKRIREAGHEICPHVEAHVQEMLWKRNLSCFEDRLRHFYPRETIESSLCLTDHKAGSPSCSKGIHLVKPWKVAEFSQLTRDQPYVLPRDVQSAPHGYELPAEVPLIDVEDRLVVPTNHGWIVRYEHALPFGVVRRWV